MLSFLRIPQQPHLRRFICRTRAPSFPSSCHAVPLDLERYREAFAKRMEVSGIKTHHRIALGVSGGADSMALCVLAAGWKKAGSGESEKLGSGGLIDGLLGIIIDHKLRPESTEEAKWVFERVTKMGIRCEIASCDWSEKGMPKQGQIEEAARDMRYQIFQDVCSRHQIGILLVAHHADDQEQRCSWTRWNGIYFSIVSKAFGRFFYQFYSYWDSTCATNPGILQGRYVPDMFRRPPGVGGGSI